MSRIIRNPFTYRLPSLDLHGEFSSACKFLIETFIQDNIKMKNKEIIIIHGKGYGVLKRTTHEILKTNKQVLRFYIDPFNEGQTIVFLKI